MNITKYITYLICLVIALVFSNEVKALYYFRELSTHCWEFSLDDTVDGDQIKLLGELAAAEHVTLYTWDEDDDKQGNLLCSVYETGGISDFSVMNCLHQPAV